MKNIYALQPYHVGTKNAKSLAIVIPSEVAKKYNLDTSTIFALRMDDITKTVVLRSVRSMDLDLRHNGNGPG
jgi:hypothetical protein